MSNYFKNFPLTSYAFKDNLNSRNLIVDIFRNVKADINLDDASSYLLYEIQENERPDQISQKFYDTPEYFWTFFILNEHLWKGMAAWPKEYNQLMEFVFEKYKKTVITSFINIGFEGDNHLLIDKFEIGEEIVGQQTYHRATISEIDVYMNRLVVDNATGDFGADTVILGLNSQDELVRSDAYDFSVEDEMNAVHHYENIDGIEFPRVAFSKGETDLFEVTNREYEERINDSKQQIKVLKKGFIEDFARAYKKLINQ